MQLSLLHKRLPMLCMLLMLLGVSNVDGQDRGSPFVANYLPKDYGGHAQNWAIAQDQRGVMYFGNGNGLMEYDGSEWRITALPKQSTGRSMDIGSDGVVYVGTSIEIGYASVDDKGNTAFVSLNHRLPDSIANNLTDVWATEAVGDEIFFRSYYCLMRYNVKTEAFKYWELPANDRVFSSFILDGKYFCMQSSGLKVINGDAINPAPGWEKIKEEQLSIAVCIPYKQDTIILGNRNGSFYKYPFSPNKEEETNTFFAEINQVLSTNRVYTNAIRVAQGYALGSLGSGLLVFSPQLEFIAKINEKDNGLQNTTIFAIYADRDGAAWVAGSNGIGRVDLAADISFWDSKGGISGNGYSAVRHKNTLFASTSESLFYYEDRQFKIVKGLEDTQSWHLMEFQNPEDATDKRLLIGAGSRVFEVNAPESKIIASHGVGGAFKLYTDKLDPSRLLIATSDGMAYMHLKNGQWLKPKSIPNTIDNNRSISVDPQTGDIWVGTFRNGVIRIIRDVNVKDSIAVKEIKRYGEEEGLLSNKNVIIFEVAGRRIFGTDKGLCEYNANTDRFEPCDILGKTYCNGSRDVFSMQEDATGNLWFCGLFNNSSPAGVARKRPDGSYALDFRPFQKVPPMMCLALYVEPDGTAWLGGSEGFFKYKPSTQSSNTADNFHSIIRQVRIGQDSVIFGGNYYKEVGNKHVASIVQHDNSIHIIDAGFNVVAFRFAAPFFDNEDQNSFKFKLEGFDTEWSPWEKIKQKEYTNLPGKEYTFRVVARNLYGEESTEASYRFEVLPPWYKTPIAYLCYILGIGSFIWMVVRINARRLKLENERLERLIDERTLEVRKKNAELEQQKEEIQAQANILQDANERISEQKDALSLKTVELSQQKEEILAQAENLRDLNEEISSVNSDLNEKQEKLERSYTNIQTLSDIGQEITATLNLKHIIKTIYENVNMLMDASGFGVGVYNEVTNSIDFNGYMEKGQALPDHSDSLNKDNLVSIQVFKEKKPIISNDLEIDMAELFQDVEITQGDIPLSMMYLPLIYREESVGVITVQSFQRNAYTENEISIFKNLASYASIAVANAISYQIIRTKNNSITDSIRYSRTMQAAFLPSDSQLHESLGEHFLIYQPKDIVSGDFYWVATTANYTFVAVVDCTGHGVPGSFMSIIGTTILNEIVNMTGIYDPAEILEELNTEVIRALHQNEQGNDDGMDLALIRIENKGNQSEVVFTGAKNDLYYIRKDHTILETIEGTRKHIGGFQRAGKSFENHTLLLDKGDAIYLSSDGMADQNNSNGKKFGTVRVKSTILASASLPMGEQGKKISAVFDEYTSGTRQRDDITLLGFRL